MFQNGLFSSNNNQNQTSLFANINSNQNQLFSNSNNNERNNIFSLNSNPLPLFGLHSNNNNTLFNTNFSPPTNNQNSLFSTNQNRFVLPTLDVIPTTIYNQYNMYSITDINSKDKQTFKYIAITANPEFSNFSFEEIRYKDMNLLKNGHKTPTNFNTNNNNVLFGFNNNYGNVSFGVSSLNNQQRTFSSIQNNSSNTGGIFGNIKNDNNTNNTCTFSNNNNLFINNNINKNHTLFGNNYNTNNNTLFENKTNTTSLFGNNNNTNPTSLFLNNNNSNTNNLFGNNNNTNNNTLFEKKTNTTNLFTNGEVKYDNVEVIKYDSTLKKEVSFISLASTLMPMAILYHNYLGLPRVPMFCYDKLKKMFDYAKEINIHHNNVYEILTGYDSITASTYLESTMVESGIAIPVIHDKFDYFHGRTTLSYKSNNGLILFNNNTELDKLLAHDLKAYYTEIVKIDCLYQSTYTIANDFYNTICSMYLTKKLAENKKMDLSKVDYSPMVLKLHHYKGEM